MRQDRYTCNRCRATEDVEGVTLGGPGGWATISGLSGHLGRLQHLCPDCCADLAVWVATAPERPRQGQLPDPADLGPAVKVSQA